MTKEQLIVLIQDKLNGGVTNSDNQRKFHYRDVEYLLSLIWSSAIDQMKASGMDVNQLMGRFEVDVDEKGRAELMVPYINMGSGFPVAYGEDEESSMVIWPRKNQMASIMMESLHAAKHIATVTPYPNHLVFRNLVAGCKKAWVWVFPQFEALEKDQELNLPSMAAEVIYDKAVERAAMKLQIPIDNANDGV